MSARFTLASVALLFTLSGVSGQQYDAANFVRGLYQKYAGIDPDRAIVDVWVRELNKGTSAAEVHAQILGSNQTFDGVGKSYDNWVRLLYVRILNRDPDPDGLRTWEEQLRIQRYDRVKVAREFLRAAGSEINAGGGYRPGGTAPGDLPTQLKAASELLSQAVTAEFPGYQHFLIRSQVGSFTNSVAAYQPILKEPNRYPREYPDGVKALVATLDAFEQSVAQSKVIAPSTRVYTAQCRQLLVALTPGGVRPIEPGLPPVIGGERLTQEESREYRRLLESLSKDLTAAETTFRIIIPQGWSTTQLINRVDDMLSEVDHLRDDLRSGYGKVEFVRRVQSIETTAGTVTKTLNTSQVDVRAMQAWYSVSRSLTALTLPLAANQPQLPGGTPVSTEVVRAIDKAVAECDALLVSFAPYATFNRSVGRLTTDLTDLKNRYAALRRTVTGYRPAKRDLEEQLNSINARLNTVTTNWRDVVADRVISTAPDLTDLTLADREVTRLTNAIR